MQSWPTQRRTTPAHNHRGFTLFEIVIALAMLTLLIGMTWPSLDRSLAEYSIKSVGTRLAQELASGRIRAIDNGAPYDVRWEPAGHYLLVMPANLSAATSSSSSASMNSTVATTIILPDHITFAIDSPGTNTNAQRSRLPDEWLELIPDSGELASIDWAGPIRFYEDGTASDALISIIDDDDRRINLSLRGLTGNISVSPVIAEFQR